MSIPKGPDVTVRVAKPEDGAACGAICFAAFSSINGAHGFPSDFPDEAAPAGLLSMLFSRPDFYCVVAEHDGRIVAIRPEQQASAAGQPDDHPRVVSEMAVCRELSEKPCSAE